MKLKDYVSLLLRTSKRRTPFVVNHGRAVVALVFECFDHLMATQEQGNNERAVQKALHVPKEVNDDDSDDPEEDMYESDEENSLGFSLFNQQYLRNLLSASNFASWLYSDQTSTKTSTPPQPQTQTRQCESKSV